MEKIEKVIKVLQNRDGQRYSICGFIDPTNPKRNVAYAPDEYSYPAYENSYLYAFDTVLNALRCARENGWTEYCEIFSGDIEVEVWEADAVIVEEYPITRGIGIMLEPFWKDYSTFHGIYTTFGTPEGSLGCSKIKPTKLICVITEDNFDEIFKEYMDATRA